MNQNGGIPRRMSRRKLTVVACLLLLAVIASGALAPSGSATPSAAGPALPATPSIVVPSTGSAVPASGVPTYAISFPRTVMIETFTAVWCIHCPAESAALFNIDRSTNRSVIDIAELHVCAFATGQGPCLENYVTPDGTSNARAAFYNVCGFPDVFFDGNTSACGATSSIPGMQNEYDDDIANVSVIPAGVSISQSASVVGRNVTGSATITSALTGSYNVVTYLVEWIGLQNVSNGYGPHDIGNVVRETLFNHPVSLTDGATTPISFAGGILPTWNSRNLSVVTFVQQNSTKFIENANMVPATTLTTTVSAAPAGTDSGGTTTVTVRVANSTTGAPLPGATVSMTANGGASVSPAAGTTNATGEFTTNYTAPKVNTSEIDEVYAQVTAANYTGGTTALPIVVSALVAPDAPRAVSISAGEDQVALNWTPPSSGVGSVLTYHVYRSASATGPFAPVGTTNLTNFTDTSAQNGLVYWYEVDSQDSGGYSPNTTAIAASSVVVSSQGLPSNIGWWISLGGSANFSSLASAPLDLFLPTSLYNFEFGARSYAYVALAPLGSLPVQAAALTVNLSFSPRYATLEGTVSPATATLTLNGTAVPVVAGSFNEPVIAGVYALTVTASGYTTNTTTLTLTPGNVTPVHVVLAHPSSSTSGGGFSLGGLSSSQSYALLAGVAVLAVVAVVAAALLLSRKPKGRQPAPPASPGSP